MHRAPGGSHQRGRLRVSLLIARTFSNLDEIRAALKSVTVVAKPVNEHFPVANLHWIIGDKTGSIVVECMQGDMRIWENDVDVLTNEPDLAGSTHLRNYLALTDEDPDAATWGAAELTPFGSGLGMQGIPGDYSGPSRFVKAAFVNSHYPTQAGEAGKRDAFVPHARLCRGSGRRRQDGRRLASRRPLTRAASPRDHDSTTTRRNDDPSIRLSDRFRRPCRKRACSFRLPRNPAKAIAFKTRVM